MNAEELETRWGGSPLLYIKVCVCTCNLTCTTWVEVWSPSRSGFLHSYGENTEGRLNWKIMFALFLLLNHRLNPSPLQKKTASCLFSPVTSTVLRKFSAICRGNSLQLTRPYKPFHQLLIHLTNRYEKQSSILEKQIHPQHSIETRNEKMRVSCWHLFLSASSWRPGITR